MDLEVEHFDGRHRAFEAGNPAASLQIRAASPTENRVRGGFVLSSGRRSRGEQM
jgi:hypothetical protein